MSRLPNHLVQELNFGTVGKEVSTFYCYMETNGVALLCLAEGLALPFDEWRSIMEKQKEDIEKLALEYESRFQELQVGVQNEAGPVNLGQ